MTSADSLAGPSVQMIFARLKLASLAFAPGCRSLASTLVDLSIGLSNMLSNPCAFQ